jgi:hypothetical protein
MVRKLSCRNKYPPVRQTCFHAVYNVTSGFRSQQKPKEKEKRGIKKREQEVQQYAQQCEGIHGKQDNEEVRWLSSSRKCCCCFGNCVSQVHANKSGK